LLPKNWHATVLASQNLGKKFCHHFSRINVRCGYLLAPNQVMAQELAMPKFWHATILVANQLGPKFFFLPSFATNREKNNF